MPGASHSGGPSASCSNGAHAHGAGSDQGPAVGGERRWGSVGRRWGSGGHRRPSAHGWFSGRILACHAGGPGSIPGPCRRSVPFWCPQPQSGAGFPSCHTQGTGPATARSPPHLPAPVLPMQTLPPHTHPGARPPGPDTSQAQPLFRSDPFLVLVLFLTPTPLVSLLSL